MGVMPFASVTRLRVRGPEFVPPFLADAIAGPSQWEQEVEEMPSWGEAHRCLVTEGRRSAVEHPSAAHEAMDLPAPVDRPS